MRTLLILLFGALSTLRTCLALFWLPFVATSAFGVSVSVNGTCLAGNCASPDQTAGGSSPTTVFNFVFTLANSDQYRISGNATGQNTPTSLTIMAPFTVAYLGNSAGGVSGADVLTIDFSQSAQIAITSGNFSEATVGGFSGPIAAGSSLQGQLFIGSKALPVQGPFSSPANFSSSSGSIAVTGLASPLLMDSRRTITFAAGSGVGATVYNALTPGSASSGASGDPLACGGVGSTLPILRPVHAPLAADSSAGIGGCGVVLCTGANQSDCNVAMIDTEGGVGGTLPILVYDPTAPDSSGGSTLPILVFGGPGAPEGGSGSTLPILVYTDPTAPESGGGATLPILLIANSGGASTLPIDRPSRPFATAAVSTAVPLEIATPPQSVASRYSAVATCPQSATCWMTIPMSSGTIAASTRAGITAIVSLQGLPTGTYTAKITITITSSAGQTPATTLTLPINLVVGTGPNLALSQTALQFQAISGATAVLSQSISVTNSGTGTLSFNATAFTSSGNWLSIVPPASGTAPAQVAIQASAAGLTPGTYFGRVNFSSPGNGSQSAEVVLIVSSAPTASISSTGLIFVTAQGTNPLPQTVVVSNTSSQAITVAASVALANGNNWFTATQSASTTTSAQPITETVSINSAGLSPGVYLGTLDLHLAGTNTGYPVEVLLIVKGASCIPTRLLPVITNLAGGFQKTAGIPVPLQALIVDDCGTPLISGSVLAYFPGGDPALSLTPLGQGEWSGTWQPHSLAGGAATVGLMATSAALYGSAGVMGTLAANPNAPVVNPGGAVNAASLTSPLAPGSFISIFGKNLATAVTQATSAPYPITLGNTQVLLGGEAMPLQVVTPSQINAVVPFDALVASTTQLIVEQNGVYAEPETVVIASAQPGVFTQNQSGTGAGVIVVIKPNGSQFLNTPTTPASAGGALVIYGTGLGAVSPAIPAGSAAPLSTLSYTSNPVTVTVGGQIAQVLFAGLSPGFVGLYQINAVVPPGIPAGPAVPVIVSVSGVASVPVTVAIQ